MPNQNILTNEFVKDYYNLYFNFYAGAFRSWTSPNTPDAPNYRLHTPRDFDDNKFKELVRLAKIGYDLEKEITTKGIPRPDSKSI